jgi:hypothetical protein
MCLTANKPTHSMVKLRILILTLLTAIQQLLLFRLTMGGNVVEHPELGRRLRMSSVPRSGPAERSGSRAMCRSVAASSARSRSDEQVSARDYPPQRDLQFRLGGK